MRTSEFARSVKTASIRSSPASLCQFGFQPRWRIFSLPSHQDTPLIPMPNHGRYQKTAAIMRRELAVSFRDVQGNRGRGAIQLVANGCIGRYSLQKRQRPVRIRREGLGIQIRVRSEVPNAYHASVGTVAEGCFASIGARPRSISPKLINSHFHQRRSPREICLRIRMSGTNPSYSSRQPAFLLP